jgi:hypothetical protein
MTAQPAHAKNRPPSAASRWLSCPSSAYVTPLYPNDESDASLKGDTAHDLLENGIRFGLVPNTDDPDMDMNIMAVLKWIKERRAEYGKDCQVYAEQRLDIPQTGEWGTCDIAFVAPTVLHIADYKNGYVYVDVKMNAQLLVYLLGLIAKYGTRKIYRITVLQPNFDHVDGPFRTYEISHEDLEWFEQEVIGSVRAPEGTYFAGSHCKKTYCPHRGSCTTFMAWARTDAAKGWWPHELNALDDIQLAQALDHADTLQGTRDELRKEAMRRILQHGRSLDGYKVVRSRTDRTFKGEAGRAACYQALIDLGYSADDLVERTTLQVGGIAVHEQKALTVAGVERMVKQKCKAFGNGVWKTTWDAHFAEHVLAFSGSLTLTRAYDGRPAHTRGSEFGTLTTAQLPSII